MIIWLVILTLAVIWCGWSIHQLCGAISCILKILKDNNITGKE